MISNTIEARWLQTISWLGDNIIDWPSSGTMYTENDKEVTLAKYRYSSFDGVVVSADSQYVFIYKKLGTKGLLLKNGELLREINRSYYFAEAYEYPAAFAAIDDVIYLVHCPLKYNRIDFENVETGELITDVPDRKPSDVFHSRFEVSPGNTWLMSKGWYWHPRDGVEVFNIKDCLQDPLLLDRCTLYPEKGVEINTATFINDSLAVIGSNAEACDDDLTDNPIKHIGIWDVVKDEIISNVKVEGEFGNLFAINESYAWDMFKYPKVIELSTGKIVDSDAAIFSGDQTSSMIGRETAKTKIAYNRESKQIAVAHENIITILSTDIR